MMVRCSMCWTAFFVLGLVGTAAAHKCDDGARVTCLAVQSLPTDKDQNSHGKGARGTPHCTPDDQKVYCLVNHNYHGCKDGQQPCCSDGSNPWHRHSSSAEGDDLTCGGDVASMVTGDQQGPVQVILDDMDNTLSMQGVNAFEGSFAPCMQDAYNQQFHHDWGENKGHASFTFSFEAPRSGCYMVEEHHPGNSRACAQYMPRSTPLVIQHEAARSNRLPQTFSINQAENGGQWNKITSIMLSPSAGTDFIMRNAPGEECDASTCFWVADAIRLTWTGETCSSTIAPFQDKAQDKDSQATVSSIPTELPQNIVTEETRSTNAAVTPSPYLQVEHLGLLTLHAQLTHSHGHSHDHSHADITARLKQHQNVLEMSLAAHFSFTSVQILTMTKAGRRLAEEGAVNIHFAGQGDGAGRAAEGLEATLQNALSAANAGLTIMEAKVAWTTSQSPQTDDVTTFFQVFLIEICLVLTGLLVVIGISVYWLRKKANKNKVVVKNGQAVIEGKTVKAYIITEAADSEPEKKFAEQTSDNASVTSTMSPASSSATIEEVDSCEGKNEEVSHGDNEVSITIAL